VRGPTIGALIVLELPSVRGPTIGALIPSGPSSHAGVVSAP
jgi:hypothetical protein